jgi:hypothetical protein
MWNNESATVQQVVQEPECGNIEESKTSSTTALSGPGCSQSLGPCCDYRCAGHLHTGRSTPPADVYALLQSAVVGSEPLAGGGTLATDVSADIAGVSVPWRDAEHEVSTRLANLRTVE